MKRFEELQLRFEIDGWDPDAEEAEERQISFMEAQQISAAAKMAFGERVGIEEGTNYYGDYLRLVEHGWPWRVAVYIAWAASPKSNRWPRTLNELATQVLGLASSRRIHTWREKHPAIDETVAILQAAPLFEHRRDVIDALVEMARTPDYKAFNDRKLFLEMTGDYTPKSKLEVGKSAETLEELSDAELQAWLGEGGSSGLPVSSSSSQEEEEAGDGV